MDNRLPFHAAPLPADFDAFAAAVRTRLPERRQLPAHTVQGLARLGRLIQLLRTKQHWSLDTLAARTSLPWLWLALLEQGMLLPGEVTEARLRQLGRAFPSQRSAPNPEVLFLTLAQRVLRLPLPYTDTVESRDASASRPLHTPVESQRQPRTWATAVQELGERLVHWVSPPWQPTWAGKMVTAADVAPQEHVFAFDDGDIQVTCGWRAAYGHLPTTLRVTWHAHVTLSGDFWLRFTHPTDPTRPPVDLRLGNTLAGEEEFTAVTLGFDPTRDPWALTILLKAPEA